MERPERYPHGYFIPELIEDEDIIFNKDSEYHKQRKKEKKNPIFKRNKPKKSWGCKVMEEVIMATLPNKELNRLIKIEIAVENLIENGVLDEDVFNQYLNEA